MPWINHLPPVCWSTFGILVWNDSGYVNLTQWWYFFIIFEYILHISTPHIMIFCFPLPYFPLSTSALFLLSTLVLTLYIDVVLSLSTARFGTLNSSHTLHQNRHGNIHYYSWETDQNQLKSFNKMTFWKYTLFTRIKLTQFKHTSFLLDVCHNTKE